MFIIFSNESRTLNGQLLLAVKSDVTELAVELLDKGASPLDNIGESWAAIHWAAWYDNSELIQAMYAKDKKCIDARTRKGMFNGLQSPLHIAIVYGRQRVIEALLQCGANVNSRDQNSKSAIHLSLEKKDSITLKKLCEPSYKPSAELLVEIVSKNDTPNALMLIEAGMSTTECHKTGFLRNKDWAAIHWAAHNDNLEILSAAHAKNSHAIEGEAGHGLFNGGQTPLLIAADYNKLSAVELLINIGATLTAKDRRNQSVLSFLCSESLMREVCTKVPQEFLNKQFLQLAKDNHKNAITLLENGASPLFLDGEDSAIHAAVKNGNETLVKAILIKHPSAINLETRGDKHHPIHTAALNDKPDMISLLHSFRAKINQQDRHGYTPLHHAAECDYLNVIMKLIDCGARTDIKTNVFLDKGKTAINVAILYVGSMFVDNWHKDSLSLPIEIAVHNKKLKSAKFLLSHTLLSLIKRSVMDEIMKLEQSNNSSTHFSRT